MIAAPSDRLTVEECDVIKDCLRLANETGEYWDKKKLSKLLANLTEKLEILRELAVLSKHHFPPVATSDILSFPKASNGPKSNPRISKAGKGRKKS